MASCTHSSSYWKRNSSNYFNNVHPYCKGMHQEELLQYFPHAFARDKKPSYSQNNTPSKGQNNLNGLQRDGLLLLCNVAETIKINKEMSVLSPKLDNKHISSYKDYQLPDLTPVTVFQQSSKGPPKSFSSFERDRQQQQQQQRRNLVLKDRFKSTSFREQQKKRQANKISLKVSASARPVSLSSSRANVNNTNNYNNNNNNSSSYPKTGSAGAGFPSNNTSSITSIRYAPSSAPISITRVKGAWRPEEDQLLATLVSRMGPRRWTAIAAHIPGRTGKQARERWLNQLSPNIDKRSWTNEEDAIILSEHSRIGNKWSEIAKLLVGRTDNAVKNRFNTTIRRQIGIEANKGQKRNSPDELSSEISLPANLQPNKKSKQA